jgi:hypothetical protein
LIQQLFQDPVHFLQDVVPVMRRFAHQGAHRLVQRVLYVVAAEIRSQAVVQRTAASIGAKTGTEGRQQEELVTVAMALVSQALTLFRDSALPLRGRDVASSRVRDVRFIAPFLSLVPRSELKALDGPIVALLQFTASDDYNEEDVRNALREIFVKFPLPISDGVARGLSPQELMVFLHHDVLPVAEGKAPLGDAHHHHQAQLTVPMFKAFVPLCLGLSRTFERWTIGAPPPPMLYDIRDCLKVLQGLLRFKPLPSQLMFTAVVCCRVHADQPDLTLFVVSNILSQLAREAVWDTDPVLWRDVELFCDEHWQDTHGFLFNLPDRVLLAALKENGRMREAFVATQSGNASFSHILSSL